MVGADRRPAERLAAAASRSVRAVAGGALAVVLAVVSSAVSLLMAALVLACALAWRAEQAVPRVVWKAVAEKTGASITESRTVTLEGELSIPPSSQPSFTFGGLAAYVSTCVHDT